MSFNFDEKIGDNNYNCPVVAYYPEVIAANTEFGGKTRFINDYVGPHKRKFFPQKMTELLSKYFSNIDLKAVKRAADAAFHEQDLFLERVRTKSDAIITTARAEGHRIIVLAGRPYHTDPEINHGYTNIVCTQPFGCLPTHVCGKGMIHKIKEWYPHANIVPIDYDPGATKVNQENRIKLMLSVGREALAK